MVTNNRISLVISDGIKDIVDICETDGVTGIEGHRLRAAIGKGVMSKKLEVDLRDAVIRGRRTDYPGHDCRCFNIPDRTVISKHIAIPIACPCYGNNVRRLEFRIRIVAGSGPLRVDYEPAAREWGVVFDRSRAVFSRALKPQRDNCGRFLAECKT